MGAVACACFGAAVLVTAATGVSADRPLLDLGLHLGLLVSFGLWVAASRGRSRRRLLVGGGIVVVVALGTFGVSAALGVGATSTGLDRLRGGLDATADGDQAAAVSRFGSAQASFRDASSDFRAWWAVPAALVPLADRQLDVMAQTVDLADEVAGRAARTSAEVDLQGLKASKGEIDLAKLTAMQAPLADAATDLRRIEARAQVIDRSWVLPPIADRVTRFQDELGATSSEADLAAEGVRIAPRLLGGDGPRRYLVIFASPSEARELGGFMGNEAVLLADHGKVTLESTGRATELSDPDGNQHRRLRADGYPARYLQYQPERNWQNITGTPDFPTVARAASDLLPQSGGPPVDGVMYVDPYALAAMLKITGPIYVKESGQQLTADNAAQVLLRDQYVEFADKGRRVDFLDQVASLTFEKLIGGELPGPRRVVKVLGPMVEQRRLLVHSFDPDEQIFLRRIGLNGRFPEVGGDDFLSVVHANANPNKIDSFLHRSLDYQVNYDPTSGDVDADAAIGLRNDAPSSGLPDYVIGSNRLDLPPGTNHLLLSVYSRLELREASVDGRPVSFERTEEYGRARYTAFVDIPPGGTARVRLALQGRIDPGPDYRLALVGQPVANPDEVTVGVHTSSAADDLGDEPRDPACTERFDLPGGVRAVRVAAASCR